MKKLLLISIGLMMLSCTPEEDCGCEAVTYREEITWTGSNFKRKVYEVSRYEVTCQEEKSVGNGTYIECN